MSEVKFSKLKIENGEWRIDSEYFKKEYLNEDSDLAKHKTVLLGNYAFVTDGQHGYYETDPSSKIHMLAARNCKDYFANTTDSIPLAKWVDDKNKRSSLAHGDIILSTRGSVGCCAIVYDEVLPANINQDVARIKLNNSDDFRPEFLIAYMNCKFGQNWMFRNQTGMVQQGLPLDKVRSIPVPMLSPDFQSQIEQIVKSAHSKLAESKSLYAQAEEILLSELGLKDWQPKNLSVVEPVETTANGHFDKLNDRVCYSVKSFSDFAKSGRLDAEYYQPKYDEIEEKIKSYKGGSDFISKVVELRNGNFNPQGKSLYKYIELADIGASGEVTGCTEDLGGNLPSRARRIVHTGDVLISSIEGSLQSCAIVGKEYNDALCSTGFYVVSPKLINAESLLIVLKSSVMQSLLKKGCSGTILTAIPKEEFLNLPIPLLPESTQSLIAEKIQKSFDLRKQSKELLENAKRMVEEEIEK